MSNFSLIEPTVISDDGGFTRASTGAYFDRDGILRTAAINEPRLNYPPMRVAPPPPNNWQAGLSLLLPAGTPAGVLDGLPIEFLAEAAATNLMLQSQDISGWTAASATFGANVGAAPDSSGAADAIVPSAAVTAVHGAFRAASTAVAAGAVMGASIFLKAAGYATTLFRCAPVSQTAGFEMRVNLSTGEILVAGGYGDAALETARVYALPGGWYRLEMVGSVTGATTYGLAVHVGDGDPYPGDAVSGVLAWGWQLELGQVTSYIATTTTAATRAADVGTPMLVSGVLENEPVWSAATTYATGNLVRGTGISAHTTFVSLVDGNLNNALTDDTKWLRAGATNRWRMFDKAVSSRTTGPEALDFIVTPSKFTDTLVLLGLSAGQVRVAQVDAAEGVVYDRTYSLVDDSEITDWYAYFFNDVRRKTELVVSDLKPYATAQIAVMLSDVDATVQAGECVVGRGVEIGTTQAGVSVGIQDYSRKVRDDFGNYSFVERAYSRRMRANVLVEKPKVDAVASLLAAYRAQPIVYIAAEAYSSTIVYGIAKDWDGVIAHPEHTIFALDLESLI